MYPVLFLELQRRCLSCGDTPKHLQNRHPRHSRRIELILALLCQCQGRKGMPKASKDQTSDQQYTWWLCPCLFLWDFACSTDLLNKMVPASKCEDII